MAESYSGIVNEARHEGHVEENAPPMTSFRQALIVKFPQDGHFSTETSCHTAITLDESICAVKEGIKSRVGTSCFATKLTFAGGGFGSELLITSHRRIEHC